MALAAALGLVALGCGAPAPRADQVGLIGLLKQRSKVMYLDHCREREASQKDDEANARYLPAELDVRSWRGSPTAYGAARLPESAVMDALKKGRIRSVLVEARSGLGKTKLLESIHAHLCDRVPVFVLDLKSTLLPGLKVRLEGENAVFNEIARSVGLDENPRDLQRLNTQLAKNPWVLLLDGVDEISVDQRDVVVREITSFLNTYKKKGRVVVFSRPPVYRDLYGFGDFEARLEIAPLTCTRSDERVLARAGGDTAKMDSFFKLAEQFGLSRKRDVDGRCIYPHMASYRDVNVVVDLAARARFDPQSGLIPTSFAATRTAIYADEVGERLAKLRREASVSAEEAMEIVDEVVAGLDPSSATRSLTLKRSECERGLNRHGVGRARRLCESLFQSKLFVRAGETFTWTLDNQSLTDFFVARWIEARLAVREDGCAGIKDLAAAFESSEVASFLVGMPHGEACASEIIVTLCQRGAPEAVTSGLLDQGLPAGPSRKGAADRAVMNANEDAVGRCIASIAGML